MKNRMSDDECEAILTNCEIASIDHGLRTADDTVRLQIAYSVDAWRAYIEHMLKSLECEDCHGTFGTPYYRCQYPQGVAYECMCYCHRATADDMTTAELLPLCGITTDIDHLCELLDHDGWEDDSDDSQALYDYLCVVESHLPPGYGWVVSGDCGMSWLYDMSGIDTDTVEAIGEYLTTVN